MTHTTRRLIPVLAGLCALAIAACGSSGTGQSAAAASGAPSPAAHADFLKVSECMRAHGVSNFPDPGPNGGIQINSSSGLNPQSPTFQSAMNTCSKLLPGGGPGNHPIPEAQRLKLIAMSQCMRTHGVPSFPDPQFQGGGVRIGFGAKSGINPQSPAFQQAQKECGSPIGGAKGKGGLAIAIRG